MSTDTSRRYNWIWAALGGMAMVVPTLAAEPAAMGGIGGKAPAIVGRWDITITQGDRQSPSWISVKPAKDGKFEAEFLGTGGGVHSIDPPTFEKGVLTFKVGDEVYTGKLAGDTLEGSLKRGDRENKWVAHRYVPKVNVAGKWNLTAGDQRISLNLKQEGKAVTGKWVEAAKRMDITQGKVVGNRLTFMAGTETHSFDIKGDMMLGNSKAGKISGLRQRKLGKPVNLLEGKAEDLKNWEPLGKDKGFHWTITDGVLTNGANHTENTVTKRKDFWNFKLHVEFKVPPDGNSGVYLRGRHEIQVADSFGRQLEGGSCGALYSRIVPAVNACKKPGEWQEFDITIVDDYVTVIQNGQKIIDNQEIEGITGGAIDSKENEPGPIYLQGDHTEVWYRKIVLTPLE